jgi:hypothetical protein
MSDFISIHRQLEQARNHNDINLVRERIELEIDVDEAKRGYFKSCDILESVYDEDDLGSMDVDYDNSVDGEI